MIELFHGSQKIIRLPIFGAGNPRNDYGLGLYCTADADLAKEWACSEEEDGFANRYQIETNGLSHLHLNEGGYNILNWLAILLENRTFDLSLPTAVRAKKYILDNFLPDYRKYDMITGYRADDSYFSFSRAFLSNGITLDQLKQAMSLGKLGEQIVIKVRSLSNGYTLSKQYLPMLQYIIPGGCRGTGVPGWLSNRCFRKIRARMQYMFRI